MIRNILFFGVLAVLIYVVDALLTDVIGNLVLRMLAAAAITVAGSLIVAFLLIMARERWPRAS